MAPASGKARMRLHRRGPTRRQKKKNDDSSVRVAGRRVAAEDKRGLTQDILGLSNQLLEGEFIDEDEDNDQDAIYSDKQELKSSKFSNGEQASSHASPNNRLEKNKSWLPQFETRYEQGDLNASASGSFSRKQENYHASSDGELKDNRNRNNTDIYTDITSNSNKSSSCIANELRDTREEETSGWKTKTNASVALADFVVAKRELLKKLTAERLAQIKVEKKHSRITQAKAEAKKKENVAKEAMIRKSRNQQRGAEFLQEQARRKEQARQLAKQQAKEIEVLCEEQETRKKHERKEHHERMQAQREQKQKEEENFLSGVVLPKEYPKLDATNDPELYGCDLLTRHLGYTIRDTGA